MDSATTKRKKKRRSKENEGQSLDLKNTVDTGLTSNTAQANLVIENFKIEDEVAPIEDLAEGNVSGKRAKKRKRNARAEIEDGGNLTSSNMEEISAEANGIIGQAQSLVEGIDAGKSKEKKRRKKKAAVVDEVQQGTEENLDKLMVIADDKVIIENPKIQNEAQTLAEGCVNGKRRKKRKEKKGIVNDEEIGDGNVTLNEPAQTQMDAGLIGNVTVENPIVQDEIQSIENPVMGEGIATVTRKKKPKRKKIAKVVDELSSVPETRGEMHSVAFTENLTKGSVNFEILKVQGEIHSIENPARDERNVAVISKKKPKKKKSKVKDELSERIDTGLTENPAEVNVNISVPETKGEVHSLDLNGNLTKESAIFELSEVLKEIQRIQNPIRDEGNTPMTSKKKPKKKKKAKVEDELSGRIDTGSTENPVEVNVHTSIPETRGEVHSAALKENLTKESANFEIPKVQDEIQSIENVMDEGNVTVTKKKKLKKKMAKVEDELSRRVDTGSTENLAESNVNISIPETKGEVHTVGEVQSIENLIMDERNGAVIRKKKPKKKKAKVEVVLSIPETKGEVHTVDEVQSIENPLMDEGNGAVIRKKKQKKKKAKVEDEFSIPETKDEVHTVDEVQSIENPLMDEGNGAVISKKKPKKKKAKVEDELAGRVNTGSTENLTELNVNISISETMDEVHSLALKDNLTKESVNFDIPKSQNEIQSIENPVAKDEDEFSIPETKDEVHTVDEVKSIENPLMDEGNGAMIRKKKPKKKKAKVEDELAGRVVTGSIENLTELNVNISISETMDEVHSLALKDNLTKESVNFDIPKSQNEIQSIVNPVRDEGNVTPKAKKKPRKKKAAEVMSSNGLSQVLDEGRSATSTCNEFAVKDAEVVCCRTVPFAPLRRKLLVLDLNGMLADIIYNAPTHRRGDTKICGRAVFKRPFCDDFLKFCFQNFYVGIWSSRTKKIIDPIVSFLLGDLEAKLAFCWDQMHTTKSGFMTLENNHKPLVCKDLRKIWEHDDPSWPWKKGDYNESNTLLLDDSPYKALLNPPHTAIFPPPYEYTHENDNSLGPGGDLRVYLEGLLTSENVQTYVKEHPFGQLPISEQSTSWEFYNRVINKMSKQVNAEASPSVVRPYWTRVFL